MRNLAALIALLIAAPALAQDAPAGPTGDQLCYSWLSLRPATVARLIVRELAPAFDAEKLPQHRRARVLACVAGGVQALQPQIRQQCTAGEDPSDGLRATLPRVADLCIAESAARPDAVLPWPAPESDR